MHATLRELLGDHVQQKGSLVNADKLRFDFAHTAIVDAQELQRIEDQVNQQIRLNSAVNTQLLGYDEAVEGGATALFGEKYGDEVRVLSMGDGFSMELCGGTHVERTGDIGLFRIVSEGGIAAGIRRIEAVTGDAALALIREDQEDLATAAKALKVSRRELVNKIQQLVAENKDLSRQLDQMGQQLAASKGTDLINQAVQISDVSLLAVQVEGDNKSMMQVLESLLAKMPGDVLVLLAVVDKGKVGMAAAANKALSQRLSAAELLQSVAPLVGAKGGGRPDLARAGGGDKTEAVDQALAAARQWVEDKLAS